MVPRAPRLQHTLLFVGSLRLAHTGRHHHCSCIYLSVCACEHVHAWRSEHTCWSHFSSSTTCIPRTELKLSGLVASAFTRRVTLSVLHCHHGPLILCGGRGWQSRVCVFQSLYAGGKRKLGRKESWQLRDTWNMSSNWS